MTKSELAARLDACNEAYLNNTAERDMYEVAYRDMRAVVKGVLERHDVPPNIRTRLEAVFMDGEVNPG